MSNIDDKVVRLGIDGTRSLHSALITFMQWFNNRQQLQKEKNSDASGEESKAENKSSEYTDMNKFYKEQFKQGNTQFLHDTISTQGELDKFSQLAKGYGVSYLIEKKPFDIAELIQKEANKENLSSKEKDQLDNWCEMKDGERVIKDDTYQITFAVKDAVKLEALVKELAKWRQSILDARIEKSEGIHKAVEQTKDMDIKLSVPERGV